MTRFALTVFVFIGLTSFLKLDADIIYENALNQQNAFSGWNGKVNIEDQSLTFNWKERSKGNDFAQREIDAAAMSGKVIRLSCEAKGRDISDNNQEKPYNGCKVQMHLQGKTRQLWVNVPFPAGNFGWKKIEMVFSTMPDITKAVLNVGMQNSSGCFQVKNLKIEMIGAVADITAKANRSLDDAIAGDGKGGWTDQGSGQDGIIFAGEFQRTVYSGIPMLVNPNDRGILVMKHKTCPDGPEEVTFPLDADGCKTIYLMHTLAWAQGNTDTIGSVTILGENDKKKTFPVICGKDVGDWYYSISQLPNGYPAVTCKLPNNASAGVYISKYNLPADFGKVRAIRFQTTQNALWLILAATATSLDTKLSEKKPFVITADKQWLPIAGNYFDPIKTGSALDCSSFSKVEKVGAYGRVIINKDGHFAFERKPNQPVRFFTCTFTPRNNEDFNSHKAIESFVAEVNKCGYNMIRTHFLDSELMKGADKDLEFNPEVLERFDYLIYCMKEQGIYLNFDLMTSWIGYKTGNISDKENQDPLKSFKARIHFEPAVRDHWRQGVEKILCHVNKYTGTRLIDDPVLVMAIGYNEQEYGFWRPFAEKYVTPAWREFLRKQYGSIDNLKKSWGDKAKGIDSFEQIPCFPLPSRIYDNDDVALFLREVEGNTLQWYQDTMKNMGYPGPVTGYNCGKNQYYNMIRKDVPFIAMNSYHAHPSNWILQGSSISQNSAIAEKAKIFRDFVGVRLSGKPLVVTEHNLAFWNKYRYEQAFVVGAYSAFQSFDGLTCHGSPVSFHKDNRILTFGNYLDPIARTSEFLTFFLYRRGDISPANQALCIRVFEDDVFRKNGLRGSMPTELSLSSLVAATETECISAGKTTKKTDKENIFIRLNKTGSVMVSDAGFSQSMDSNDAGAEKIIDLLKKKKLLSSSNRSDGKTIFESSTDEILMDSTRKFMQINTPRFQGICAEAGTKAELKDLSIEKMSTRGTLSLVSIDGMKTIYDANRLMLVYATNALNSNMKFSNPDMTTLQYVGDMPILLEQGSFKITLNNQNAAKLKLYPLDLSGNRLKELSPEKIDGNRATFQVATLNDGASVFFEIQAQ